MGIQEIVLEKNGNLLEVKEHDLPILREAGLVGMNKNRNYLVVSQEFNPTAYVTSKVTYAPAGDFSGGWYKI